MDKSERLNIAHMLLRIRDRTPDPLDARVLGDAADFLRQCAEQGPMPWRDHVERRLHSWRQRFVNKSGDQLALDDFMDRHSLDDLIDYVCDAWAGPDAAPQPGSGEQPEPSARNWWCPHCRVEVPPEHVTYTEHHDPRAGGCGNVVQDRPEPQPEPSAAQRPFAWVVLDESGHPEFVSYIQSVCHDHINDAISEHGIDEAARWVVRPVYAAPVPQPASAAQPLSDEALYRARARVADLLAKEQPAQPQPEPTYRGMVTDSGRFHPDHKPEPSAAQIEAAYERAAQVCDERASAYEAAAESINLTDEGRDSYESMRAAAESCANAIRALKGEQK